MQPLRARVRNGRLVLDEPTDRPEGEVVELVPLDAALASGADHLDEDELTALYQELQASLAESKAAQLVDLEAVLAELRAIR